MQAIKPGMTGAVLLTVFTTEEGRFTGLQRTYVSQDCRYFPVDVKFEGGDWGDGFSTGSGKCPAAS